MTRDRLRNGATGRLLWQIGAALLRMEGDTIFATASAPGGSARAVVRVSGPDALAVAGAVFSTPLQPLRAQHNGVLRLGPGVEVEALALVMPGPRSFTGEDVVELHLPGSPMLLALLGERLCGSGVAGSVRQARPGEFSARAYTNGRIDVAQAEGILTLIHAADAATARRGAAMMSGGLSTTLSGIRRSLQDALAMLEAGLDFEPGETGEVDAAVWLQPLQAGQAALQRLLAQLPEVVRGGEVLLLGRSNAGKSSLANALCGRQAVVVGADSATTRDLVRVGFGRGEGEPEVAAVWDAPGDLDQPGEVDRAALLLRQELSGQAAASLWVIDSRDERPLPGWEGLPDCLGVVFTHVDMARPAASVRAGLPGGLAVFEVDLATGGGVAMLREFLCRHSASSPVDYGAVSRGQLQAAAASLEQAIRGVESLPPEMVALDLQQALAALTVLAGRHSPEDLLDRVFSRFCLGK